MDASRFGKRCLMLVFEIWLQSYIRPVVQASKPAGRMEFAGEGLISLESSKDLEPCRFAPPRSDLLRHQSPINLRKLSAIHSLWFVNLRRGGVSATSLLVSPVMGRQRPDRLRHFIWTPPGLASDSRRRPVSPDAGFRPVGEALTARAISAAAALVEQP